MTELAGTMLSMVLAAALALAAVKLLHRLLKRLARRSILFAELIAHAHRPFQIFMVLLAARGVLAFSPLTFSWRSGVLHVSGRRLGAGAWA